MRLKTYLAYAIVLLGSLASCTQVDEPLSTVASTPGDDGTPNITATLSFNRARALEFDLSQDELTLTENPENFDTHAFFYHKTKKMLGYAKLRWEVRLLGNGSYQLTLPNANNFEIELIEGGTGRMRVNPGEGWYVTGFAGGGVLSSDKKSISFPDNIDQPKGKLLAPLSFKWRDYSESKFNIVFEPLGVVIRPIVYNETNSSLNGISLIESNGLSNKGTFNVSVAIAQQGTDKKEHLPWTFDWTKEGKPAPILSQTAFSVSQSGNSTQTYLSWGMVYTEPSQNYKIRVDRNSDKYYLKKVSGEVFNENLRIKNGTGWIFDLLLKVDKPITPPVLPPDTSIDQYHNPLNDWLQGNLQATGVVGIYPGLILSRLRRGVWTDEGDPRSIEHADNTYFTWAGINTLLARSVPVLDKFIGSHLPSAYEFAQLFPNPTNNVKCINFGSRSGKKDITVTERVALGRNNGGYQEYRSTYRSTAGKVVYALRHVGHGNHYRTAFRYELQSDHTGVGIVVKVQAYLLGSQGEVTIDQVSDEAWWRSLQDCRVLYFSAPGYSDLTRSSYLGGSPEILDGNGYDGYESYYGGIRNRFGRSGLFRPRLLPRLRYREPNIVEKGQTAYYWSTTGNGCYGLKITSNGIGRRRSDESVFIQVAPIVNNPNCGFVVRLKRC